MSKIKSNSHTHTRARREEELKTIFENTMQAEYDAMKVRFDSGILKAKGRDEEYAVNIFRSDWENNRKNILTKIGKLILEAYQKFRLDNTLDEIDAFISLTQDEEAIKDYARFKVLNQIINENPPKENSNDSMNAEIEETSVKRDFTTARQVIALHYIFEELSVKSNPTEKSKFIHFLTNKNEKNIYDCLLTPFASKKANMRTNDLLFVKKYFESLNMNGVVKKINDELNK